MQHINDEAELVLENRVIDDFSASDDTSNIYWLKEGANYFGKDLSNHIIYPGDDGALFAGILFLKNDQVLLRVAAGQRILHNRKPVDNIFIFAENTSLELEYGASRFRIVRVKNLYGLLVIE